MARFLRRELSQRNRRALGCDHLFIQHLVAAIKVPVPNELLGRVMIAGSLASVYIVLFEFAFGMAAWCIVTIGSIALLVLDRFRAIKRRESDPLTMKTTNCIDGTVFFSQINAVPTAVIFNKH